MSAPVAVSPAAVERSEPHPEGDHPRPASEPPQERYDKIGRRLVPRTFVRTFAPLGDWVEQALCAEVDGDLWYPDANNGLNGREAKAICGECEVRTECLEYAMRNGEQDGIWGGLSPQQRVRLRQKGNAA